jgi:hypothetical protein
VITKRAPTAKTIEAPRDRLAGSEGAASRPVGRVSSDLVRHQNLIDDQNDAVALHDVGNGHFRCAALFVHDHEILAAANETHRCQSAANLLRCTPDLTVVLFGRRTLAGRGKNELRSQPPKRESASANGGCGKISQGAWHVGALISKRHAA